jgi:hypothetical protein
VVIAAVAIALLLAALLVAALIVRGTVAGPAAGRGDSLVRIDPRQTR